jgi:lipopolysaccharide transport system ATP-binding protein
MFPLLRLQGVSKSYPVPLSAGDRFGILWALLRGQRAEREFAALQEINLEVYRGQSLGLVGENGAGKSTLLKIIAGVVKPTRGRVTVNGKIGALLELGAGFHPEYSGRENIFLSAALMGMPRGEIAQRLDEILAFADIGEHIDQPIKHYSSGMVVRLGFAIATTMKPELLITDEVLAVGDESFQKKCVAWMEGYLADGGTLLLCSHSMYHIQKLCQTAIWIHHGQARSIGAASEVTREYLAYHEEKARLAKTLPAGPTNALGDAVTDAGAASDPPPQGDLYQVRSLLVNGVEGDLEVRMRMGETLEVSGTVYSPDHRPPNVAIGLVRADGTGVYGVMSDMDKFVLSAVGGHLYGFTLRYPNLPLLPGRYQVRGHAMDPEGLRLFDHVERVLDVQGESRELGVCRLQHEWCAAPGEHSVSR